MIFLDRPGHGGNQLGLPAGSVLENVVYYSPRHMHQKRVVDCMCSEYAPPRVVRVSILGNDESGRACLCTLRYLRTAAFKSHH